MKNKFLFILLLGFFSTSITATSPNTKKFPQCQEYKKRIEGKTGKEAAKDVPTWITQGNYRPCKRPNEDGKTFADRAIRQHYNVNEYKSGANSEFNKIRKFGDRAFQ